MERKLTATICVALMIGLGVGYWLGYTIWQPKYQNLQEELDNLGNNISALQNGIATINSKLEDLKTPKPKTVRYGEFFLEWADGSGGVSGYYDPVDPNVYVGNYTRMSILIRFDKIATKYGEAYWTVTARWTDPKNNIKSSWQRLSSTLFKIRDNIGEQIGTDSYAINGPYIQLWPEIMNNGDEHEGNATISIYLFLTYGTPTESTLKTLSWQIDRDTNNNREEFGEYITEGYRQITIRIWSNVSCYVAIRDYRTMSLIDTFNKTSGWVMKTYQIAVPSIGIVIYSPSSKPWNIEILFYMTT